MSDHESRPKIGDSLWAMLTKPLSWKGRREAGGPELPELSGHPRVLASGLIAAGICDERGVNRAWLAAQTKGKRFEDALTRLSVATERSIAEVSANILNLPLAHGADFPASPLFKQELRPSFLRQARCCPMLIANGRLVLGLVDGFDDFTPRSISAKTGLSVSLMIVLPADLEVALARLYPADETVKDDPRNSFSPSDEDLDSLDYDSETAFVIKHVDSTITAAVESGASDIHFETFDDRLCVRFRQDGSLVDMETLPLKLASYVLSRLKIMAHLDIAERRLPQDGRFKVSIRGHEVNFRLSTMPSLYGETAVVRVLDRSRVGLNFHALGLGEDFIKPWLSCLTSENGILLVVGPTGSGKSTTLYTSLHELNSGKVNITTVEDPIEYYVTGINQSQIKPQIGLTFASCLRSMLRQDPDVIMVGEIRDLETATIAVQASMTGHLVLSTLHTNSAAAAITRLRDIGLESYAIASVIRGIAAQRLLRRLCDCKRESSDSINLRQMFGSAVGVRCDIGTSWEPVGCLKCRATGYKGRFAVAELIIPDKRLKRLINRDASQDEIEAALEAGGMQSLFDIAQDAISKGFTSVEEVARLRECV